VIVPRKTSKGDIRYGIRVYVNGERQWLGTFDKLGRADKPGTAKWAEAQALQKPTHTGPTCDQFVRSWLDAGCPRVSGRKLKDDTLWEYQTRLRGFLRDFKGQSLTEVSREQAFEWALSHRSELQFIRAAFSHAHDLGLITENPFVNLHLQGSPGRKHLVPLTEKELHVLADTAPRTWKHYGPTFRAFILFQAYTGMRPGETFALEWADIEGDNIHVRRRLGRRGTIDLPKSNVERTILLPPPAREALQTFPRGLDLVFRGIRGQRLSKARVADYWRAVRKDYGRTDLDLYDMRHFAGHHMYVRMGLPARVVAVQLGHRDGGRLVEQLYGHGSIGALDELREAWAAGG
jgi:integrase